MSESTLYLHIGMPKAASSYLHSAVFPFLMPERYLMPGAANAKKPEYQFRKNRFAVKRFSDAFHQRSDFWHQHGDEFLHSFLAPFLSDESDPKSVLVSDEAITRLNHFNLPRMPDAFVDAQIEDNFRSVAESAGRLGFKRTKVLLVIRRQDLLLASSYAQLSRKIIGASQKDFEKRVTRLVRSSSNDNSLNFFPMNYYRLHECLRRSLGKENVLMLPLEELSRSFEGAIKKMAEFFNIEQQDQVLSRTSENARSSRKDHWGLRPLLLFKSRRETYQITAPRFITRRAETIELTPGVSNQIMSHYRESNSKLNNWLNTDLSRFGYCS
ncbi:MAG: hypothetical protein PF501_05000 [Salinisphaera sp.]|jgi:hypothetical protein|nr:hypothetical protein [Salinisphaera sp.]